MKTHRNTLWITIVALVAGALLAACSPAPRPQSAAELIVPTQVGVNTVDTAGVFASVRQHLEFAGLKADRARTDAAKFVFVSQPARCSPNSDERNVKVCVFSASAAPNADNPLQVAIDLRVRPGERVKYEADSKEVQIRIEPTLDGMVGALRSKFPLTEVTKAGTVTF